MLAYVPTTGIEHMYCFIQNFELQQTIVIQIYATHGKGPYR